eukprot:3264084-Alexandrium_andersonii.AAC.1
MPRLRHHREDLDVLVIAIVERLHIVADLVLVLEVDDVDVVVPIDRVGIVGAVVEVLLVDGLEVGLDRVGRWRAALA